MAELLHVQNCVDVDSRALAWPRLSRDLTFLPRRPQHRPSPKAVLDLEAPSSTQTPDSDTPHNHFQPKDEGET